MFKKYSKVLLILMVIFSLGFSSSVSASSSLSQNECPACNGEKPSSTGSKENIEKTKDIVFSSEKLKTEETELDGKLDKENVIITAPEENGSTASSDLAVATFPVENSDLNNIVFTVDLESKKVTDVTKTFVEKVNEETANITIKYNGEIKDDITLTSNKVIDNLTSTEYTYEEYIEKSKEEQNEVEPMMSCEEAVGILTSSAGAAQCYLICADLLLLGGLPGLGCSVICSAALFLPLDEAADRICN